MMGLSDAHHHRVGHCEDYGCAVSTLIGVWAFNFLMSSLDGVMIHFSLMGFRVWGRGGAGTGVEGGGEEGSGTVMGGGWSGGGVEGYWIGGGRVAVAYWSAWSCELV